MAETCLPTGTEWIFLLILDNQILKILFWLKIEAWVLRICVTAASIPYFPNPLNNHYRVLQGSSKGQVFFRSWCKQMLRAKPREYK